jgi:peptidylprolyl isomerase
MPPLVKIMTDIELLTTAWSEEQATHLRHVLLVLRFLLSTSFLFFFFLFYSVTIAAERKIKGAANVPPEIRIGCAVYFDVSEEGREPERIVFGLFTDKCPLYCEYFHRMCCGNTSDGRSFLGQRVSSIIQKHVIMFGDGMKSEHAVPDFNPSFLPQEHESEGAWRGALSAISYAKHKQSPNFCIHMSAGEYTPQVFGMVIGGYEVLERVQKAGGRHGSSPRRDFVIEGCGEVCTLDKGNVTPLPWALYSDVSRGYDRNLEKGVTDTEVKELDWQALLLEEQERVMSESASTMIRRKQSPTTTKKWLNLF